MQIYNIFVNYLVGEPTNGVLDDVFHVVAVEGEFIPHLLHLLSQSTEMVRVCRHSDLPDC